MNKSEGHGRADHDLAPPLSSMAAGPGIHGMLERGQRYDAPADNSSLRKQRHRDQGAFLVAAGHSQVLGGFGRQMRQL
ncbi:MAG: hypothetical protein KK482_14860 [Sinorhizobium meliloti]|uniref:hypothetical protein n=1 Tax=Rhizobium meliloti TaxID=382 RepID=UPI003F13C7C4|nr:hypothetical protein [Sinorhizobium meliloti]